MYAIAYLLVDGAFSCDRRRLGQRILPETGDSDNPLGFRRCGVYYLSGWKDALGRDKPDGRLSVPTLRRPDRTGRASAGPAFEEGRRPRDAQPHRRRRPHRDSGERSSRTGNRPGDRFISAGTYSLAADHAMVSVRVLQPTPLSADRAGAILQSLLAGAGYPRPR